MNFIFACLAATLCAKADRVDSGKVWLEQPKLDEVAECIPDTGGHCNGAEGSCNEDHGKTDCRDDKCFCKPGFCALRQNLHKTRHMYVAKKNATESNAASRKRDAMAGGVIQQLTSLSQVTFAKVWSAQQKSVA
eukprot:TRINITY_DN151_c0_g1_i2.p1 TRINITY_DN151_c0_g1~~TRINITY_DN151_c0_g1_i2.p1  ORF type:complete len:134 (-),score=24.48 TRINITY_DN151_c0_g1_i2:218-619(-)